MRKLKLFANIYTKTTITTTLSVIHRVHKAII